MEPVATAPARQPLGRAGQAVRIVSWLALALLLTLVAVLNLVSERTWWGTVLTFLPRQPYLCVPGLLLMLSMVSHRRSIVTNLVTLAVVAGPLMGARVSTRLFASHEAGRPTLTIVSCNVQGHEPDFESVLREIDSFHPDVVVLQEAFEPNDRFDEFFKSWNVIAFDEYRIASHYPMRQIAGGWTKPFERRTVVSVHIDGPDGPFVLHNVHLTTARKGLLQLSLQSVRDGSGPERLERYTQRRLQEASETKALVAQAEPSLPAILAGDFNTLATSSLYTATWREYTNAFDAAGVGFGYTSPCAEHRHWPNDFPWLRIDHVLADEHWRVSRCRIGVGNGSDHRPICAVLTRR